MPDHYDKKKKKTTSEKVVGHLKQEASKRNVGNLVGLNRNAAVQKAFDEAFK